MDSPNLPGFSSHVQNQLFHMSQDQRDRGRGRGRNRGRYRASRGHYHDSLPYNQHLADDANTARGINQSPAQSWTQTSIAPLEAGNYPPLGSSRTASSKPESTNSTLNQPNQMSARDFFDQARGGSYRGRGGRRGNYSNSFGTASGQHSFYPSNGDGRHGSSHPSNRHGHPAATQRFATAEQQRAFRQRIMEQSDYLNDTLRRNLNNLLSKEELTEKHMFRKELESIAQAALKTIVSEKESSEQTAIRLECYGSLANSFGVAGCDMDLLLTVSSARGKYDEISEDAKRALEKAILDNGYGARLLTNTRVPILRVCQRPGLELFQSLREHREKWERSLIEVEEQAPVDRSFPPLPNLTAEQQLAVATAVLELDDTPTEVALPPSPTSENAKLEYLGDCGIQCDVNFTNHVALLNTKLLWTYGQCDIRVRQMGIFVKNWAKARDINTPYRGTLSSYGFVLMVLHYVMNITNPPLVPNLQQRARDKDSWNQKPVELFEGFDVRFTQSMQEVQQAMSEIPKNHESLGALLRGFFCYYATPQGFNWTQDVISIRTSGGIIPKKLKGWTEAKWSNQKQNVRLRYLCAIEDPFETEHNVARTVGHSGIVAIRDEFRRAWSIIEGIYRDPQSGCWMWSDRDKTSGGSGDELTERLENRGDLLKKDHEERKRKLLQMKQEAEAREELLRKQALESDTASHGEPPLDASNGTCKGVGFQMATPPSIKSESTLKLINSYQHQHSKLRMIQAQASKKRQADDEDELCGRSDTDGVRSSETDALLEDSSRGEVHLEKHDTNPRHKHDFCSLSENDRFLRCHGSSHLSIADDPRSAVLGYCSASRAASLPVGNFIEWNQDSKGGRWLSWRDKLIREDSWTNPAHSVKATLNARFPYNPAMTQEQLRNKNAILGKWYLYTLYPSLTNDARPTPEERRGREVGCTSRIIEEAKDVENKDVHQSQTTDPKPKEKDSSRAPECRKAAGCVSCTSEVAHQPSGASAQRDQIEIDKSQISPKSQSRDLFFVKEQRLAFFTKAGDLEQKIHSTADQDVETRRRVTEAVSDKASTLSRKDSAVEGSWNALRPEPSVFQLQQTDHIHEKPSADLSAHDSNHDNIEIHSDIELSSAPSNLFAASLAQVRRLSVRRRLEEDDSILPVPLQLDFQIDPRQLADLKIIEAGGNPCAMPGYEFAYETSELSWGGGGSMGGRLTELSKDSQSQAVKDGLDYSQADNHALLMKELPGYDG